MANGTINEESFFFLPVESACQTTVVTCDPGLDVISAARLMREHDLSGLVVVTGGVPVGILSVRDLRDLVASGEDILQDRVDNVMTAEVVTVRHNAYLFEAIFKMAKHNIHRLVVLNDEGCLVGVLTDTDVLRIQTRSPIYLHQELEAAESIADLREGNRRMLDMVERASKAGADTKSLVQLISHFNDAFSQRIIALLGAEGVILPKGAAYLALGSEGRGEQTLRTDQDSAVVYADGLGAEDLKRVEVFAGRLVAALEAVGVPRCPGQTMATNPAWRHSLSEWKELMDQWLSVPKAENMVNFGMFQDFRTIHGDPGLEVALHEHLLAGIQRHALFLPYVARNIVRFKPPLGMFGRIRVQRRGEHRGKIDLKKSGIFAITEGASLLALEAGIVGGSTWDKLEQLGRHGVLSAAEVEMLDSAFSYLVQLRLQRQLRALASGQPPSNHVDPLVMLEKDRDLLRDALKGVNFLLRYIRDRYQLDFISR